jgi:hypothetical protein
MYICVRLIVFLVYKGMSISVNQSCLIYTVFVNMCVSFIDHVLSLQFHDCKT